MKVQRIYGYYIITIQILCCWVSATTSRPFAPPYNNNNHHNAPGSLPPSSSSSGSFTSTLLHSSSKQQPPLAAPESSSETMEEVRRGAVVDVDMSNKIGSSPPSCENKCYGCFPCEAIQVPTIATAKSRVGVAVMYTNYEPEGWKCKCGPSFYSP